MSAQSSRHTEGVEHSETRRLVAILVAGLLFLGVVGVWVVRPEARSADNPLGATAAPVTTTTAAGEVTAVTASQPVDVPADPYAPEPIQQIGTIEIPKIGLSSTIYHGITLRNIDLGPSHWPGSAVPGENGNTVFAGHRVTHTHPFLRINELVPGDQVIFTVQGVHSTYVVTGHEIVPPSRLSITNPTTRPTGTLFACHPPHSASFRYVVHLALLAAP